MKERRPGLKVPTKVKWLILLTAFSAVGYGYLTTAIAAYLPEIGISSDSIGTILGASGLAMILCAIPFGVISDRFGRKWIFIGGMVGVPVSMVICSVAETADLFLAAAIIAGISEGAFLSTWNAMIADQTTVDNRNLAFSLSFIVNGGFTGIGLALPIAFPWVHSLTGWTSVSMHSMTFLVLALVTLISPISLYYLLRDYEDIRKGPTKKGKHLLKDRSQKMLVKFSLNNMLIGLGAGLIIPLVATWFFLRYDIGDTYTGPLLAISNLSIIFAAMFSTGLAHRLGPVKAIAITQASSTIFMLAIPFMPGAEAAAVVYLVRSALMNMAGPIMDAYLMGIIDKDDRGLASAINSIVWRLPNSATTVIGGALLAAGYYTLPFILASVIYIVAIAMFYRNFKDVRPQEAVDAA